MACRGLHRAAQGVRLCVQLNDQLNGCDRSVWLACAPRRAPATGTYSWCRLLEGPCHHCLQPCSRAGLWAPAPTSTPKIGHHHFLPHNNEPPTSLCYRRRSNTVAPPKSGSLGKRSICRLWPQLTFWGSRQNFCIGKPNFPLRHSVIVSPTLGQVLQKRYPEDGLFKGFLIVLSL